MVLWEKSTTSCGFRKEIFCQYFQDNMILERKDFKRIGLWKGKFLEE
jgi:hypothetical protein